MEYVAGTYRRTSKRVLHRLAPYAVTTWSFHIVRCILPPFSESIGSLHGPYALIGAIAAVLLLFVLRAHRAQSMLNSMRSKLALPCPLKHPYTLMLVCSASIMHLAPPLSLLLAVLALCRRWEPQRVRIIPGLAAFTLYAIAPQALLMGGAIVLLLSQHSAQPHRDARTCIPGPIDSARLFEFLSLGLACALCSNTSSFVPSISLSHTKEYSDVAFSTCLLLALITSSISRALRAKAGETATPLFFLLLALVQAALGYSIPELGLIIGFLSIFFLVSPSRHACDGSQARNNSSDSKNGRNLISDKAQFMPLLLTALAIRLFHNAAAAPINDPYFGLLQLGLVACAGACAIIASRSRLIKHSSFLISKPSASPDSEANASAVSMLLKSHGLSQQELNVAQQLICGKAFSDIAQRLRISKSAVSTYAARLYRKLGVSSKDMFLELYADAKFTCDHTAKATTGKAKQPMMLLTAAKLQRSSGVAAGLTLLVLLYVAADILCSAFSAVLASTWPLAWKIAISLALTYACGVPLFPEPRKGRRSLTLAIPVFMFLVVFMLGLSRHTADLLAAQQYDPSRSAAFALLNSAHLALDGCLIVALSFAFRIFITNVHRKRIVFVAVTLFSYALLRHIGIPVQFVMLGVSASVFLDAITCKPNHPEECSNALGRAAGRDAGHNADCPSQQTWRSTLENELTCREREVVMQALHGYTTNHIAEILGISVHTVRTHLQHAYKKLGIHSRKELMQAAAVLLVQAEKENSESEDARAYSSRPS